jgi:hypothetical protein
MTPRIVVVAASLILAGGTVLELDDRAPYTERPAMVARAIRTASAVPAPGAITPSSSAALACNTDLSNLSPCVESTTIVIGATSSHTLELNSFSDRTMQGGYTCQATGAVSSCSLSHSTYRISPFDVDFVTATYTVGSTPGTGAVLVTTSGGAGVLTATLNVTVRDFVYAVSVTPDGQAVAPAAFAPASQSFTVQNIGETRRTFGLSVACGPPAAMNCAVDSSLVTLDPQTSRVVNVAYRAGPRDASGTVRLQAADTADRSRQDDGSISVTVGPGGPAATTVSVADANPETTIERDLCLTVAVVSDVASECGDLRVVHALTSARVMNKTRTPALLYNSRHAQSAPILAANVTLAAEAETPSKVTADLFTKAPAGSWTYRTSGEWEGIDFAGGRPSRIALSYDAGGDSSLVYDYKFDVRVWNGGSPQPPVSDSGKFILVNRAKSYFGAGWWLSGLERIISVGDGSFVWVGDAGDPGDARPTSSNRSVSS